MEGEIGGAVAGALIFFNNPKDIYPPLLLNAQLKSAFWQPIDEYAADLPLWSDMAPCVAGFQPSLQEIGAGNPVVPGTPFISAPGACLSVW